MEKSFCLILKALFVGYFYNLNPGPWTRTLKNLDVEKPGINIGLKNMSNFR